MRRKYNSGGMMKKLNDYPYINTSYQMESNPQGAQQAGNTQQKMADDQNLLTGKKYNMGGYMGVPQSQVPQEGNYAPQDMANSTMLQPPAQEMDPSQQMQSGGYMNQMQQYDNGGMKLPGGNMQPIPGSDAVQFNGNSHDDGGIMLDNQTEVEGGETMDQVNMNKKGGKRDYFFSDH